MTEAEARDALRAFEAMFDIEQWMAEQPWQPAQRGWTVLGQFHGRWHFRLEPVPGGVRVIMSARGGEPADWIVPAWRL